MQNTNTARNFVLQLGSLVALYVSLGALIGVIFGVINIAFPDAAASFYESESARENIRIGIAMILVFFPTYITLTRLVNQIRRKETGTYLTLTKWLIYLSLLVGGGILLGDLVAVILTFLNGELTVRFILKAVTLLVIIGIAFNYYILDVRGYWNANERQSVIFAISASIVALVVAVVGFFHIETPAEVRELRIDAEQVSDLEGMQWKVFEYHQLAHELPVSIEAAYKSGPVPEASLGREAYSYTRIDPDTFELCATFAQPSREISEKYPVTYEGQPLTNAYNWDHAAGRACFERSINSY